ncbi:MAG TPA: carboxyl transferase domain-containing protein [Mycobacteriales bacterium]|nr:carboxyl transferase domain-containing protein [Mycobacteriales bacterium]
MTEGEARVGDWRDDLLTRFSFPRFERAGRNPIGWPGYTPAQVVQYAIGEIGGVKVVACVWDFSVHGGSFGELDATAFASACELAAEYGEPLVSFVRTGGTRLQEGNAALVGIARTQLALRRLAGTGVPHVAVADHPTTGGVLVGVVSRADVRIGVSGATVGFAGPRVVEAVTDESLPAGSHTAESAVAAGLLDEVADADAVGEVLGRWLRLLRAGPAADDVTWFAPDAPDATDATERSGLEQVLRARSATTATGAELLAALLGEGSTLRCPGDDDTVAARVGRLPGAGTVVAVAVAARRGGRPTPAGYRLLQRAARLADRLDLPLLTLLDTPGAEPGAAAEAAGAASAIADTFDAVLGVRAPTVAVLVGEGGSGGALAAAVCDTVLVTDDGYLAALAPEGAAAALRVDLAEAADRLRLTPADLLALGLADGTSPTDPTGLGATVAHELGRLRAQDRAERLQARERRWSAPLPGQLR